MLDDEILLEFLTESRDMVDDSIPRLIELQRAGDTAADEEEINSIFRTFHSIKGSANFFELNNIANVTHAAETLLDCFRKGERGITTADVDLLLSACDFMQEGLDRVEQEGNDQAMTEAAGALHESLRAAAAGEPTAAPTATPEPEEPEATPEIDLGDMVTDEMRQQFVTEAQDLLGPVEEGLLTLDKEPERVAEMVEGLFRNVHSFKGNCGFMGLADLQRIAQSLENVLDALREGSIECTGDTVNLALEVVDVLGKGVEDVAADGDGSFPGAPGLCSLLDECLPAENQPQPAGDQPQPAADPQEPPAAAATEPAVAAPAEEPTKATPSAKQDRPPAAEAATKSAPTVRQSIRVDLHKLDALNNQVGELVIAQAMVVNNPDLKGLELERFERAAGQLDRIIRDLQDTAMAVRMIPVSGTFRKMVRLVHDLSGKFGKDVDLDLEGEDTEVDKTVAELIADPLVHIIRNSIDHGLEMPADREAAGKSARGKVKLKAAYEGNEIWISVTDDGRGIDRDKVVAKALERGLVTEERLDGMSETDILHLIFEPGFSTAAEITDVSGRGVGMDVVRKNVEKMQGSIDVESAPGKGSTITMRIPLTLAIIEGMLVRVGRARYTLPILSVRECIHAEHDDVTTPMEGDNMIRVRDEMLPIIKLADLHDVTADADSLEDGVLAIVGNDETAIALQVDEVLGRHQTVIKALPRYMGDVRSVSGCTIMGDGDVSLILDPGGLLAMAKCAS